MLSRRRLVFGLVAIGLATSAAVLGYFTLGRGQGPNGGPPDSTLASAPSGTGPTSGAAAMPATVVEAVKSLGGSYQQTFDPKTRQPGHTIWFGGGDADLKKLPSIPLPFTLGLSNSKVTAAGLDELKGMPTLVGVIFDGPRVTDECCRVLRRNGLLHRWHLASTMDDGRPASPAEVTWLNLSNTGVTDAGLTEFREFTNLNALRLPPPSVTEAGLREAAKFPHLTRLTVVTSDGKMPASKLRHLRGAAKLTDLDFGFGSGSGGQDARVVTDEVIRTLREIGLLHALWLCSGPGPERPASAKHVTWLNLGTTGNNAVTDAALRELQELTSLQRLDLPNGPLTADGVRSLAGMNALNWLTIHPSQLTDEVLRTLREIGLLHALTQASGSGPNGRPTGPADVTSFSLSAAKVTDAAVAELKVFPNLTSLDLSSNTLTAAALKELKAFPRLSTVRMDTTAVTDEAVRTLNAAGRLHALWLATTSGRHRPASPDDVVRLELGQTAVSDAGLKEVLAFRNLTDLNLSGRGVTDAGLKDVGKLKSLVRLELSGTRVTDAGLKELTGLRSLTHLDLGGTKVTGDGLKNLQGLDALRRINLHDDQVSDATLRGLREAGLLHALAWALDAKSQRPASAADVATLQLLSDGVTDAGLKELAAFPNLSHLVLFSPRVTDAGLKELAVLKKLVSLKLINTKVTDAGVAELQRALPACQVRR
jgi:internalin A